MKEKTIPYNRDKFRIGGICAAMLPVSIGIALLIRTIYMDDPGDWLIYAPIIISFIFVAPIVASICVSHLKKNAPINREDILTVSFVKSTFANFWVAVVFNFCVLLITIFNGSGTDNAWESGALVFGLSCFLQIMLYLLITLPLSFLCAIIFEVVAHPKKSKSNPTY